MNTSKKNSDKGRKQGVSQYGRKDKKVLSAIPQIGSIEDTKYSDITGDEFGGVETRDKNS